MSPRKMSPRTRWRLQHYWPAPGALVLLGLTLSQGQYLAALSFLIWLVIMIINERTSVYYFHLGWSEGQMFQAMVMSSDLEPAQRRQLLHHTPVEPWDSIIFGPEGIDG